MCGITDFAGIDACVQFGVDHIGLNFVPTSPRKVDVETAGYLANRVHGRVPLVGVFRDQTVEEIEQVLRKVPLDAIQLHGKESPALCAKLGLPVWKVFSIGRGWDPAVLRPYAGVAVRLFDTAGPAGASGGTGRTFDWSLLPSTSPHPWYLAGGLRPDNIATAITLHRPDGLDLNSGVESAPGIKDPEKLEAAMAIISVWRTQAVVVGLPGRPGASCTVGEETWPSWKVGEERQSPETETRGLMDLLEIHKHLVLDLTARHGDSQQLAIELMRWQMIAHERGTRLKFRLGEDMIEAMVRNSLGGLLELVD